MVKLPEALVIVDCGCAVRLGAKVWANHVAGASSHPTKCRLIGMSCRCDTNWPYLIEYIENGRPHRAQWAYVYSTKHKAAKVA